MIKTSFSIKDLENLCGVKAHTIRIWEKRYNLLEPERSDTNIRTYNLHSLRKILNISLLNENGLKISKIAVMSEVEIEQSVKDLVLRSNPNTAINSMKMAMVTFDAMLFNSTYHQLLSQHSFSKIFSQVFVVVLDELGLLWQTNTILPAHEHFISTLIMQKVLIHIDQVQFTETNPDKTFVLFLPLNEIHSIGLLYIHYELLLKGYKSIYLGESVPIDNLAEIQKVFDHTEFISYFTVEPKQEQLQEYLDAMHSDILSARTEKLHILGRNCRTFDSTKYIIKHDSIHDFLNNI